MKQGLHAIENASRDEIVALQTERLKWTLNSRLRERGALPSAFDRPRAFIPTTSTAWPTWQNSPSPPSRTCATTTPTACSPCRANKVVRVHASSGTTGKPTVVGYTQKDIDTWADADGPLDLRLGRPAGRHRPCRLRLRPVHRRPGRPLWCRGAWAAPSSRCPAGRPRSRCS